MPTLNSHTHCQAAQACLTSQSLSKSVSVPTHDRPRRSSKLQEKMTEMNEHQAVTKAICNKGFSGNSSILPRSNYGVGGQESSPQSLTAYSLNR